MGATPRAVLDYLDLVFRRMLLEVLPVVRQSGYALVLDILEGISQCHVAVRMMVSIALAVGGNVHELGPIASIGKSTCQPMRELLAAV